MTINAQNRLLPDWFTRIRTRQLALPRFQRFEAWSNWYVTQLFNTILQGLPAGAALILEIGNEEPFLSRTLVGAPTEGERITEHLLDGQQRLTALWRGLHNNYDERTYYLYLEPDEETGLPYYVDSKGRWRKAGDPRRRPLWVDDPVQQWANGMIPLDLFAPGDEAQTRYKEWARKAIEDPDEREEMAEIRADVRQKFATFNLPFLSLPVTTSRETALDVFIRMNTTAQPLSIYDIVVAQVEAQAGQSLHDLVAAAKERCPTIEHYYEPEELVLYASALLQGKPPTNQTFLDRNFGRNLLSHWEELLQGIERAAAFLEEERIFDRQRLPTDVVVPLLSALWARAPRGLDGEGRARAILRRYLWSACFSGRYEASTNTRAATDFTELSALLKDYQAPTPIIFDRAHFPLPESDELIAAGWPRKKERLARAILALALREGGLDLADGSSVSRANLAQREYHHLFPDAYLQRQEYDDDAIYRALNCALVTWQTNRNISDKEPERYLAERRLPDSPGDAEIRWRLSTHLIPYEEMVAGDYPAFLQKRAELVRTRMLQLCEGELVA